MRSFERELEFLATMGVSEDAVHALVRLCGFACARSEDYVTDAELYGILYSMAPLAVPFERSSEGLVLAHSDLAGVDEYVTTVIRYVERGIFKPAPVDVLAVLEELMRRIDRLGEVATGSDQAAARSQHAYAALLHLLYRQFLEVGRPRE